MNGSQEPKLYDIYGVEYNPWFLQSWFIYGVAGCFVIAIGYFMYRWYSNRTKPEISYWQQALNSLDILQSSNWSNHKQFYIQLTVLLKEYFQQRFKKQFVGTTDTECLDMLKMDKFIPESVASRFEDIIDGVMFVKFANAQSAQERMEKDLESVRIIVQSAIQK
jgi:hypothetical protein